MSKNKFWFFLLFALFFCLILLYSWFSYGMTAPNLVLLKADWFWQFQSQMWRTFFNDRQLTAKIYFLIISLLFVVYFGLLKFVSRLKETLSHKTILSLLSVTLLPLLFSYNMLSYDVFNYIFNARMVVEYQANPHIKVALDFPDDPWTRFMHNTHTPAPYWYGWTAFSLVPYVVGMDKFALTWLVFRSLSILSVFLLYWILNLLHKKIYSRPLDAFQIILVFFNPLFLIEIVSNSHNDLWMIVPAIASLYLLTTHKSENISLIKIFCSVLLLLFSVSTKQATLVLLPIWALLFFKNNILMLKIAQANWPVFVKKIIVIATHKISELINYWWPTFASLLLFIPLLTDRSQQFHPWYLTWSLVWLPLIRISTWKIILVGFSISSLYRYLPWILAGGYGEEVIHQQKMITWLPSLILLMATYLWQRRQNNTNLTRIE
ncbi:MAG: hypothetical protein ACOZAN_00255 [Patescibacteria group bacterium]